MLDLYAGILFIMLLLFLFYLDSRYSLSVVFPSVTRATLC